jgi:hypothetical protein
MNREEVLKLKKASVFQKEPEFTIKNGNEGRDNKDNQCHNFCKHMGMKKLCRT